jgi:hypothetical protein
MEIHTPDKSLQHDEEVRFFVALRRGEDALDRGEYQLMSK